MNPNPTFTPVVYREFLFPLSIGMAVIKVPSKMPEGDFDFLIATLMLWKKNLTFSNPNQENLDRNPPPMPPHMEP